MNTTNLRENAIDASRGDFYDFYPDKVREVLDRAAQTEGSFPAYAIRDVQWALRTAKGIEHRYAKDIAVGEASLSHAQRKALAVR